MHSITTLADLEPEHQLSVQCKACFREVDISNTWLVMKYGPGVEMAAIRRRLM